MGVRAAANPLTRDSLICTSAWTNSHIIARRRLGETSPGFSLRPGIGPTIPQGRALVVARQRKIDFPVTLFADRDMRAGRPIAGNDGFAGGPS